MLFGKLRQVLRKLVENSIVGEVWIDGGFVTEQIDPKDVDFVLRVESAFYENCTGEQRALMDWMNRDLRLSISVIPTFLSSGRRDTTYMRKGRTTVGAT
jgi:hypothetical protein